jgi:hypothetical protein
MDDDAAGAAAGSGALERHRRLLARRLRRLAVDGATDDELLEALDAPPAHGEAWRIGGLGEQRVGAVLEQWAETCGFAVLADLTPPGRRANIDFVVVGGGGVTVIDAKAWTGTVRVKGDRLLVGRFDKRKDLASLVEQVARVAGALRGQGLDLPVRGMLCLANDNAGMPRHALVGLGPVSAGVPDAVGRALAQGGAYTAQQVDAAVAALREAFTIRGLTPRHDVAAPRLASAAPPVSAASPAAPDVERRRRPRVPRRATRPRRRRRARPARRARRAARAADGLARLLAGVVLAAIVIGALSAAGTSSPPAATHLTVAAVQRMTPALRVSAARAAGGAVHGPGRAVSADEIRLTFRRGGCRVLVRLDRRTAISAADAHMQPGRGCPAGR